MTSKSNLSLALESAIYASLTKEATLICRILRDELVPFEEFEAACANITPTRNHKQIAIIRKLIVPLLDRPLTTLDAFRWERDLEASHGAFISSRIPIVKQITDAIFNLNEAPLGKAAVAPSPNFDLVVQWTFISHAIFAKDFKLVEFIYRCLAQRTVTLEQIQYFIDHFVFCKDQNAIDLIEKTLFSLNFALFTADNKRFLREKFRAKKFQPIRDCLFTFSQFNRLIFSLNVVDA